MVKVIYKDGEPSALPRAQPISHASIDHPIVATSRDYHGPGYGRDETRRDPSHSLMFLAGSLSETRSPQPSCHGKHRPGHDTGRGGTIRCRRIGRRIASHGVGVLDLGFCSGEIASRGSGRLDARLGGGARIFARKAVRGSPLGSAASKKNPIQVLNTYMFQLSSGLIKTLHKDQNHLGGSGQQRSTTVPRQCVGPLSAIQM